MSRTPLVMTPRPLDRPPVRPRTAVVWRGPERAVPAAPRRPVVIRLWLPLTPFVLALAPVALIAAPLVRLRPSQRHAPTVRKAWALGTLLLSLSGTAIAVDSPRAHIRIRIL